MGGFYHWWIKYNPRAIGGLRTTYDPCIYLVRWFNHTFGDRDPTFEEVYLDPRCTYEWRQWLIWNCQWGPHIVDICKRLEFRGDLPVTSKDDLVRAYAQYAQREYYALESYSVNYTDRYRKFLIDVIDDPGLSGTQYVKETAIRSLYSNDPKILQVAEDISRPVELRLAAMSRIPTKSLLRAKLIMDRSQPDEVRLQAIKHFSPTRVPKLDGISSEDERQEIIRTFNEGERLAFLSGTIFEDIAKNRSEPVQLRVEAISYISYDEPWLLDMVRDVTERVFIRQAALNSSNFGYCLDYIRDRSQPDYVRLRVKDLLMGSSTRYLTHDDLDEMALDRTDIAIFRAGIVTFMGIENPYITQIALDTTEVELVRLEAIGRLRDYGVCLPELITDPSDAVRLEALYGIDDSLLMIGIIHDETQPDSVRVRALHQASWYGVCLLGTLDSCVRNKAVLGYLDDSFCLEGPAW